jgi:hypothetical protein
MELISQKMTELGGISEWFFSESREEKQVTFHFYFLDAFSVLEFD